MTLASDLRHALRHLLKWTPLAALVALLAGTASAALLVALDWATATRESHRWLIWLLPVVGFAIGWVYLKFGAQVEAGNSLLLDEIHDPQTMVPLRMAPLVLVATALSHLFGASIGREGTALQMGGSLADQLSRVFRLGPADRRLLLMAGISAGFGSVFGTPLAGAVFGMEVLASTRSRWEAVLPCLVAALLADRVTAAWGVHHTHYAAGLLPAVSVWGLTAAALAGAVFGLVARAFTVATHASSAFMKRRIAYAPLRPFIGGLVLAIVVWTLGGWRYIGLGIPAIVESFAQPVPWWDFAAKWVLTVASLGSGFKGGEVTPLFFIGATLGNALAPLLHMPYPLLTAIGFVGVFAGAANTPIACTVMAVELFGTPVVLFAALACAASYTLSGRHGIYRSPRAGR